MLYYIIRYAQEKQEKKEALREMRQNGWRCPYFVTKRRWRRLW